MKKPVALAVLLACAMTVGCGKKGPLLQPLIRTPQKAEAVVLFQRGDKILVEWKNPGAYVDGTPLDAVEEVEIWVLEQPKKTMSAVEPGSQPTSRAAVNDFEVRARPAALIRKEQLTALRKEKNSDSAGFSYPYSLAGKKAGDLKFIFAVRVKDKRSHESDFSATAEMEPQTVPLPPQGFELRSAGDKLVLEWQAPASNMDMTTPPRVAGYNVYRESKGGPVKLLNSSLVKELKYEDGDIEYGLPLHYFVRASATEAVPYLESDDSEHREIVPKDVFPPAAPMGLVPVAGKGFIALSWEANRENDFAGYKVWRRAEGEAGEVLLTPRPIIENAYTDAAIEKGRRYRYAISSVDKNGNESPKTETVADSLKDWL